MYDLHLNSLCFVGPIPDWFPTAAIVFAVAILVFGLIFVVAFAAATVGIGGSFLRTGKLPEKLMKFAEARQPLREHKHIHYSVAATEQMDRQAQQAANPVPLDENGYDFYGIDGGMN